MHRRQSDDEYLEMTRSFDSAKGKKVLSRIPCRRCAGFGTGGWVSTGSSYRPLSLSRKGKGQAILSGFTRFSSVWVTTRVSCSLLKKVSISLLVFFLNSFTSLYTQYPISISFRIVLNTRSRHPAQEIYIIMATVDATDIRRDLQPEGEARQRKKSTGLVEVTGPDGHRRTINLQEMNNADAQLAAEFGYKPVFKREFGYLSTFSFAVSISGLFSTIMTTFSYPLSSGGSAGAVWCWLISGAGCMCLAVSVLKSHKLFIAGEFVG